MADAHGLARDLEGGQLGGGPPPGHREVVRGGAEVLADGDDVDTDSGQVGQGLLHLLGRLAHAGDER